MWRKVWRPMNQKTQSKLSLEMALVLGSEVGGPCPGGGSCWWLDS